MIISMLTGHTFAAARVSAFTFLLFFINCGPRNQVNPNLTSTMPPKILWAWERPEDLRFIDPKEFGVAFLAQTIFLEKDGVLPKLRRQPLEVSPGTYIIAVTRIETNKDGTKQPTFTPEMVNKVAALVKTTLELPDVKAVQIDFDAVVSERAFYRSMINELKSQLPPETPLTMTSLASWCTGDAWFNDFPVDEAVPMVFQMGADEAKIKTYLRNGNDWIEPLCRGSYGLSVDEPKIEGMKPGRRIYLFKNTAWAKADWAQVELFSSNEILPVSSVCELVATPNRYDGKLVRLKGSIINGLEGSWLSHPDCSGDDASVVIGLQSKELQRKLSDVGPAPGAGQVDGTLLGVFRNRPYANGGLKAPFQFELLSIDEPTRVR